jgi:hypothetical protein
MTQKEIESLKEIMEEIKSIRKELQDFREEVKRDYKKKMG